MLIIRTKGTDRGVAWYNDQYWSALQAANKEQRARNRRRLLCLAFFIVMMLFIADNASAEMSLQTWWDGICNTLRIWGFRWPNSDAYAPGSTAGVESAINILRFS